MSETYHGDREYPDEDLPTELVEYKSLFKIGDYVSIDNDSSLKACVTGILFRYHKRVTLEASWISNGTPQCSWIEEYRCKHV
jgi:hypothetical protein